MKRALIDNKKEGNRKFVEHVYRKIGIGHLSLKEKIEGRRSRETHRFNYAERGRESINTVDHK